MHPVDRLRAALPSDASHWLSAFDSDLAAAWRTCPRSDWLLRLCMAVEMDRRLLVHAAADLTSKALRRCPVSELQPRRALAIALRWVAGQAASSEAWALGFATWQVADRWGGRQREAVRAAACAAFACDDRADPAFYVHRAYAARAAEYASRAIGDGDAAHIVRNRVSLSAFLAAYDRASRPPPSLGANTVQVPITDSFYC